MHITICTAVWKRPEIFALFARGVELLRSSSHATISVVVAGSEGPRSRRMVEQWPYHYIETENNPLSNKMNATVLRAKALQSDYVLCMGSDDILHPNLFALLERKMREGIDFIGLTDFYFYHIPTRKAMYWGGYRRGPRKGQTVGAGRVLSAKLLNQLGWKPWGSGLDKMLDMSMLNNIKATEHTAYSFSCMAHGVHGVDLKSETNLTPFANWDNSCIIDNHLIKHNFPDVWNFAWEIV